MNKVLTFGVGATYGWKSSRSTLKTNRKFIAGTARSKAANNKNAVKSAAKGALFNGSKAVGGIGLIPEATAFVDGYYKEYKKDIKIISRKTNSKKRRR